MMENFDLESQQPRSSKGKERESTVVSSQHRPGSRIETFNSFRNSIGQNVNNGEQRIPDDPPHSSTKIANAWEKCHRFMKDRDNAMCKAWREEIKQLLIFAGLFSATVTAFIIESYKWLQPESNDVTAQYLGFLTAQFAQTQNVTLPETLSRLNTPPQVTSSALRINIFWFLSLVFNLSAVLVGILGYQWLREFQEEAPSLSHKEAARLRQIKYKGLRSWHIPGILSFLPLLLQAALVLFFGGILDLLWHRNHIVAALITVAVGAIILFLAVTTAAPAFQYIRYCLHWTILPRTNLISQCPFKSTQSWLILRFTLWIQTLKWRIGYFITRNKDKYGGFVRANCFDWITYDLNWQRLKFERLAPQGELAAPEAIDWMCSAWSRSADVIDSLDGCLANLNVCIAEEMVRKWYHDPSTSTDLLDRFERDLTVFRGSLGKHRAILSIYFLYLHIWQHPVLKPGWVKNVLRTYANESYAYPNPWLNVTLDCICEIEGDKIEPEIMIQAIQSLCIHCDKYPETVDLPTIARVWEILRKLVWNDVHLHHSSGMLLKDLNAHHFGLACRVSKTFQTLLQSKQDHSLAAECAKGILHFLSLELEEKDILQLSQCYSEFTNIINFVEFLDRSEREGQWKSLPWAWESWHRFTLKFMQFRVRVDGDSSLDGLELTLNGEETMTMLSEEIGETSKRGRRFEVFKRNRSLHSFTMFKTRGRRRFTTPECEDERGQASPTGSCQ